MKWTLDSEGCLSLDFEAKTTGIRCSFGSKEEKSSGTEKKFNKIIRIGEKLGLLNYLLSPCSS